MTALSNTAFGSNDSLDTLTVSHTLGGSDNRVFIIAASEVSSAYTVSTVTYGGVSATLLGRIEDGTGGFRNPLEVWEVLGANLPAAGSNDAVVTWDAAASQRRWVSVVSVTGAVQTALTLNSDGNDSTATLSLSQAVTDGDVVITAACSSANTTYTTTPTGYTVADERVVATQATMALATRVVTSDATDTNDWTAGASGRMTAVSFAIPSSGGPNNAPVIDTPEADISEPAGTAWTRDISDNSSDADLDTLTYSVSPALPTGITLNTTTGVITATTSTVLTAAADYTFTHSDGTDSVDDVVNIEITAALMSIDSATAGPFQEGDTLTITHSNASASGKTYTIGGLAITEDSQSDTTSVLTIPALKTFGDNTLLYDTDLSIVVTDGSATASIDRQIEPNTGDYSEAITALTGLWALTEFAAFAIGDIIYAELIEGTLDGRPVDVATGVFPSDTTWRFTNYSVADQSWGASGDTEMPDTIAPVITLVGSSPVTVAHGSTYTDSGATATDSRDGSVTADIVTVNPVNTSAIGPYTVTYDVDDAAGNSATQVTRTVNVTDQTIPAITLTGNSTVNLTVGDTYTEQGATWTDNVDGSGAVSNITGTVNTSIADTYNIAYNFTDAAGNAATEVIRTVIVQSADIVPTQFNLGADVTNAERSTATQRTFVIAGIDSGQTVSITATGSASVSPATGELGDTVTVTLVSSGSYSATLSGGASINGISDSFSITTRAQIVPTVSTQPTAQSVTEGQTATFTAAFTNAASVQWYDASDDSALSGETSTTLVINTVLADDGNTYYAIATSSDAATVQTNTVALSVAESTATQAPVINTGGSTSITLTVGDTYSDPAWTATDDIGSIAVVFTGTVDTATAGVYTRNGSATNPIGSDIETYTVTVVADDSGIDPLSDIVPTPIYIYVSVDADSDIREFGVYANNTWRATVDFTAPASQVTGEALSVEWSVAKGDVVTLGGDILETSITQAELIAGSESGEALIQCTATFTNEVISEYFLIEVVNPTDSAGVWEIQ